jgi:hypothetical protein
VCVRHHSPSPLPPGQNPCTHCTGGWVGARAHLYGRERKIHFHYRCSNPSPSSRVASGYINYTNPATTCMYRGAAKSLARPGRKQATATEDIEFIYPIYNHNWRNISTIYRYNKTRIKRNILTIKQNTSGSRSG